METAKNEKIGILGISDKPERYSNMAYRKLLQSGYGNLIGISPNKIDLPDLKWVESLEQVGENVHTLTLYLGASKLDALVEQILKLAPKRIITNPGTENATLIAKAREQGIEVIEGCTLVMLSTDQF